MPKISRSSPLNPISKPSDELPLETKDGEPDRPLKNSPSSYPAGLSAGSAIKKTLLTLFAVVNAGTSLVGAAIASSSANLLRGQKNPIFDGDDINHPIHQQMPISEFPRFRKLLWNSVEQVKTYHPTLPNDFDIRGTELGKSSDAGRLSKAQARYINRMLAQSPTLCSQLRKALANNVQIRWTNVDGQNGEYHPASNTITLNPKTFIRPDWKQLSAANKMGLTAMLLHYLSHELGHAHDHSLHRQPEPSAYSEKSKFIKVFVEWITLAEATASYNTFVFKDEVLKNSGLSLYINKGNEAGDGYRNSIYQEMMMDETASLKDKLDKLAAEQPKFHPDLDPSDGYYFKFASHLWDKHQRAQEL